MLFRSFQALTGDSTDNIPGVPGIGPKTTLKILSTHPTLEKIRDNFSTLKPKLQKKIASHLEAIFTYRELTRLKTDCQAPQNLAELEWSGPDTDKLREFLREYEFRSLLPRKPDHLRTLCATEFHRARSCRKGSHP